MDKIVIEGGRRLHGEVAVSGSKNSALPILISSLLTAEPCVYQNIPHLADRRTTLRRIAGLGVAVQREKWNRRAEDIEITASAVTNYEAPYELVKTMRA